MNWNSFWYGVLAGALACFALNFSLAVVIEQAYG